MVTLEEAKRLDRSTRKTMPADWRTSAIGGGPDLWARYTSAGVEPIGPHRWEGRTAWRDGQKAPIIAG